MGWINKKLPVDGSYKEVNYWLPNPLPEPTEQWKQTQLKKSYLKSDGTVTGHPGWFYGNRALASDEYFYYNYGWYTVVEDYSLTDVDDVGNRYINILNSYEEWEKFDTYKVKKTYKKYLYIVKDKPEFKYNMNVSHHLEYDDENMTVTDVYIETEIGDLAIRQKEEEILSKLRKIRDCLLNVTDYFVIISKEKNLDLTKEFLDYRQHLRDCPGKLDISLFDLSDYGNVDYVYNQTSEVNYIKNNWKTFSIKCSSGLVLISTFSNDIFKE